MYFDSHAHYDDERFDEDRESLLEALPKHRVGRVVNAAADMKSTYTGVELAKKYSYMYCSVGVHPHEVKELEEKDIETLKKLSKEEKVVAIGEIGLDYYYDFSPREEQRKWFKRQLELAKEVQLPVIIHSRDACQETFDLIHESGVSEGVIHCFSGSKELAKEYVKKGFYIGIGGSCTFKNAKKTVEVIKAIDLEQILIETDAPYLTPIPYRGERNDSSYLKYVVQKISELKGVSTTEVEDITYANALRMFKMT